MLLFHKEEGERTDDRQTIPKYLEIQMLSKRWFKRRFCVYIQHSPLNKEYGFYERI
jgi:hypothetical protein